MLRFIFISLLLLASLWVGLQLSRDPGYVLLSYQQFTLEMPLWFMIAVICISFVILHIILRTVSVFNKIGRLIPNWFNKRRKQKARERTISGMLALRKGNWGIAEKSFSKAA